MTDPVPAGRPDWSNPVHWLAFGLGAGAAPLAPGTAGTLAAVPLYLLLQPLSRGIYLSLLVILFLVGVYVCGRVARELASPDHPGIVWDEMVGYLVSMFGAPRGWRWVLAGFVLFRLFDIVKPWPIALVDRRVGGGLGIMLDDLLAGLITLGILQLSAWL